VSFGAEEFDSPTFRHNKMFSVSEKQYIATKIEELIRELNHPEMDNDNIRFNIHIDGKEDWSWADIKDNKTAKE